MTEVGHQPLDDKDQAWVSPHEVTWASWLSPSHGAWLRIGVALLCAAGLLSASWWLDATSEGGALLLSSGAAILVAVIVGLILRAGQALVQRAELTQLIRLVKNDISIAILTRADGSFVNGSHRGRLATFGPTGGQITNLLEACFADPQEALSDILAACAKDRNHQQTVTWNGYPARLIVRRASQSTLLWRLEDPVGDVTVPVLNRVKLAIVETNENGRIQWRNAFAKSMFGNDTDLLEQALRNVMRSGCIHLMPGLDGNMECHITRQRLDGGHFRYTLGEVLRTSDDERLTLLNTIPVPLAQVSLRGDIVWANQKALDLLGVSEGGILDLDTQLMSDGDSLADWVGMIGTDSRKAHSRVFQLLHGSNDRFIQVTLGFWRSDGEAVAMAVLSDATEHKALEAQFIQGHKMQAIGQLAGGIAHDFNNLLTAISGHCDLLLLRHDQGDEDFGDLVQINQNANRAAALVGQLLAFSRKQSMNPETLDLRDTLSDLTHLLNRLVGEKVNLTVSHATSLSCVRADKRKLEQVMMNLVVNARDAMPDGGEIRVETSNLNLSETVERERARVPAGDYVQLVVSDDGVGIAQDQLSNIFDPFFTTKRVGEGTGLGLSTVYGIIKQTGGFIFADSEENEGARFTLLFPAAPPEPAEIDMPAPDNLVPFEPPAPAEPETLAEPEVEEPGVVLLVEDEAPVRAFASRALRLRGINVLEASCGEEALEVLADPQTEVDVLVTDVVMPGLDGPGWVRIALETRPNVRVVFMSGYTEATLDGDGLEEIESVFLPKPFSLEQLTRTVQAQIAARPRAS